VACLVVMLHIPHYTVSMDCKVINLMFTATELQIWYSICSRVSMSTINFDQWYHHEHQNHYYCTMPVCFQELKKYQH